MKASVTAIAFTIRPALRELWRAHADSMVLPLETWARQVLRWKAGMASLFSPLDSADTTHDPGGGEMHYNVRLTQEEHDLFRATAKAAGLGVGAWARMALTEGMGDVAPLVGTRGDDMDEFGASVCVANENRPDMPLRSADRAETT